MKQSPKYLGLILCKILKKSSGAKIRFAVYVIVQYRLFYPTFLQAWPIITFFRFYLTLSCPKSNCNIYASLFICFVSKRKHNFSAVHTDHTNLKKTLAAILSICLHCLMRGQRKREIGNDFITNQSICCDKSEHQSQYKLAHSHSVFLAR